MKNIPTQAARKLLKKLEALAERGINGEKASAQAKLERLKARYDFALPDKGTTDLLNFAITKAPYSSVVGSIPEMDIANSVKWAFETRFGISCRFAGDKLLAEVVPATAANLEKAAVVIAQAFRTLWSSYYSAGAESMDRSLFVAGLYDGMMQDDRKAGELLPSRPIKHKRPKLNDGEFPNGFPEELQHFSAFNRTVEKKCESERGTITWIRYYYQGKLIAQSAPDLNQCKLREAFYKLQAKKARVMVRKPAISVHPYSIALNLGRQIRFNANLDDIKNELENKLKGLIA